MKKLSRHCLWQYISHEGGVVEKLNPDNQRRFKQDVSDSITIKIPRNKPIKIICVIIIALIASAQSCNQYKIQAIEVRSLDTYFGEDVYTVFYVDSFFVIKKPLRVDSFISQLMFDSTKNTISSIKKHVSTGWKDEYYVFKNNSLYASNFNDYIKMERRHLNADSLLKFIRGDNRWDSFAKAKPDTSVWRSNDVLEETYNISGKGREPDARLKMYYSKKLNRLKASFNTAADDLKKMKLYKTETIILPFYDISTKRNWPLSKSIEEMTEVKVEKPEKILEYINRYKQQHRLK